MDEAEQLCDRLVIMDEGRIVAEGSPRQLIDRHSTREVVELRFAHARAAGRRRARCSTGSATRVEPLADRVLVYTDARRRHGGRPSTSGGCAPSRCWCAAARSRTCSFSSPGARSMSEPAARRSDARAARPAPRRRVAHDDGVGPAWALPARLVHSLPMLRVAEREARMFGAVLAHARC